MEKEKGNPRLWLREQEDARELAQQGVEVWTEAVGGHGIYLISNLGRFRRLDVILRGSQSSTGYILYSFLLGTNRKSIVAHRMVLHAFDGEPPTPEHTDGSHLNDNKTDNRLCNLEWATRSSNMRNVWRSKQAGRSTSTTSVSPVAQAGRQLDEALVQRGIDMYEKGRVGVADLAELWGVSYEVARRAVEGTTWPYLRRTHKVQPVTTGRRGENHPMSSCSDEQLTEGFRLYVEHRWSSYQFAEHLGIKQETATAILTGRNRKYLPRPEGFRYPWPDHRKMNRISGADHPGTILTKQGIEAALGEVMLGSITSMDELSERLQLSKSATWSLARGTTWKEVSRPEGLMAKLVTRTVLSAEEREAVVQALLAGEARDRVAERFNLSSSKLQSYITKVNKMQSINGMHRAM